MPSDAQRSPSKSDVGILALVPEAFDRPWASRHHLLTRLARRHPVVWMDPPRGWREVLRPVPDPAYVHNPRPAGFSVYRAPGWLPRLHRPEPLARWLDTLRLRAARQRLIDAGCRRIVLYLWRPEFAPALDRVAHDISLYHIDDEYSFSTEDGPIDAGERALIERVDRVFIHSPGLLEKKGHLNPGTIQVPNGVDFDTVSARSPEPEDLASIPGPRIGFTGWLKNQLDWDLIEYLTSARPDWSFVFVGAAIASHAGLRERLEALGRRPNVYMLGGRSSKELVRYPGHFDACIMPYRVDGYTRYIYPLKLHEYLATGRPVVSSAIRTALDFEEVVGIASNPDEWIAALEQALSPKGRAPEAADARRRVAAAHDWLRITERVEQEIASAVATLDA